MGRLAGKHALITGGTSGIGLETARQFLKEGAKVAITGRSVERLEDAKRQLGADVIAIANEAGDIAAQRQLAAQLSEAWPVLDVVFINAGDVTHRPLEDWDEATYDALFATNLKGPFFPRSGTFTAVEGSGFGHSLRLGFRSYRLVAVQRLCRKQGWPSVTGADLVRRVQRQGYQGQWIEPRSNRNTCPWQAWSGK